MIMKYPKISSFKTPDAFLEHLKKLNISIPFDRKMIAGKDSPLAQPLKINGKTISNRFCILPMEGWDCPGGRPSEFTRRRWRNFGGSGAKLLWMEATAVREDGKSNPGQLTINRETLPDIVSMYKEMLEVHRKMHGNTEDLAVGLQLTHSGRFSRPYDKNLAAKILYRHPILDKKFSLPDNLPVMTDEEIDTLIEDFVKAAGLAKEAGFDFVDVKHCHGYLGHEFLSAVDRPGKYGGSFENRTRFLRNIVDGIKNEVSGIELGVRLSMFDFIPFKKGKDGVGIPENDKLSYKYAFGGDGTGLGINLSETEKFLELLQSLGIKLICATAGSPYYNPHVQRPAMFPPSDGYLPPEDPLVGVARQITATAEMKKAFPGLIFIGSAYTYLQDYLPNVAQAVAGSGMADMVGLGRMALPYPDIVSDILSGKPINIKRLCRTISDCTTAPRHGLVSGCYPLDLFYKQLPEAGKLKEIKKELKK